MYTAAAVPCSPGSPFPRTPELAAEDRIVYLQGVGAVDVEIDRATEDEVRAAHGLAPLAARSARGMRMMVARATREAQTAAKGAGPRRWMRA